MARIEILKPFILRWEGGFVNDKDDAGGATNKGVTIKTFRQFFGKEKTIEDLKKITDKEWTYILYYGYWNPFMADYILDQNIANICVDWAWGSGTKTAIKQIQKIVKTTVDGVVGPKTLAAINNAEQYLLFLKIKKERFDFIDKIIEKRPSNIKFKKGWINRLNDIKYL